MNNEELLRKKEIQTDIMRYKNNSLSFWLCILAIVLNVIMFIMIYRNKNCVPGVTAGLDLIVNVIFLLAVFLISEKSKAYNKKAAYSAIVVGVIQIARIFWMPLYFRRQNIIYLQEVAKAEQAGEQLSYSGMIGLEDSQFRVIVVLLIVSAVALFASSIVTLSKAARLQQHLAKIEERGN